MEKVFIVSLGCPKNLTDAEVMAGELLASGYELTHNEEEADIALVNTCAFLSSAAHESELEIEHFLSLKKRGKLKTVAVAGCLGERLQGEILKRFPELDAVIGVNALDKVVSALREKKAVLPPHGTGLYPPVFKARLTAPHSAYLKIADGCNNHCSYCLIPSLRGRFRSKPMEAVIEEAQKLVSSGAKEISLIAQDTTSYGTDLYGRPKLFELLRRLERTEGLEWLRLMYIYPERLTKNTLALMRDSSLICHYLDMPLQHISDEILKRMNRRSSERSIRKKIREIRALVPDIALRTNFIVGFPGETGKDFSRLEKFIKETRFDNLGVFKYSQETGTSAASFPEQLSDEVKTERFDSLIGTQSAVINDINTALKGKTFRVLMDSPIFGRTYRDAPDIDGKVEVITNAISHKGAAHAISRMPEAINCKGTPKKHMAAFLPMAYGSARGTPALKAGDFVKVKITGASGYTRRGIISSCSESRRNK